jgi:hypothetical protein
VATRQAGQIPFFASVTMMRLPQSWHLMYCGLIVRFMEALKAHLADWPVA